MKDSKKNSDIHYEAITNFDRIQTALYEERKQCLEDRRFYSIAGAQWEGLNEQFENKPKFEVNKVHLAVIKIINEYRNNRISVDFVSKDGSPNDELADICDGLFRSDEKDSRAEEAYDNAFEEAVGGGIGAFRFTTEYENEEDDEDDRQRIRIEAIYDADSSVFFDLDAKRQDKSDAKYAYVVFSMTPEEFEMEYPDSKPSPVPKVTDGDEYDWYTPDLTYIAEYYRIEEKKETIYIYKNIMGEEERYHEDEFEDTDLKRELKAIGSKKIGEKKVKRRKVHKYIISGSEILEDEYLAGKNIPIVPVYGKRWFVDGIERCMGHVRLVKDVQRLKNMLISELAEISSLSPREKPIFTPEQVAGHEDRWANDNIMNWPYLTLNPITDAAGGEQPAGPIGFVKPPVVPPALAALMQICDMDMKELLGNSGEADKMISHVSGKAHEMIQKRIDGQAFIYMSNFSKGVKRGGEIWLSMAKDVYVEKGRAMKTIDTMDKMGQVKLLNPGFDNGKITDENDLTKATFDVNVDVGPASASQREATVQTLTGMLSVASDAETQQVLQAMIMLNMEGDGISEIREYFRKKLVNMGALKPTDEEAKAMEEAAKSKEPSAEEQAYIAMAKEAEAKALKAATEEIKLKTASELDKAKTVETYSSIESNKLSQAQAMAQQQAQQEQARQKGIQDSNKLQVQHQDNQAKHLLESRRIAMSQKQKPNAG